MNTLGLIGNVYLYDGQKLCDQRAYAGEYLVDGHGATVTFIADDVNDLDNQTKYTPFTSKNGEMVTVKNLTITGEYSFMTAGYYHEATALPANQKIPFQTTFENVNIINAKVMPVVVHQALFCEGVTASGSFWSTS